MSYGCIAQLSETALKHNFAKVRQLAPHSRVMAMIKANAYGHGSIWAAKQLPQADAFGVARLCEAIALRQAGIKQPIVLVEGILDASDLAAAFEYQLELVLHDFHQIDLLENAATSQKLNTWIKIDTGMHRIGFLPEHFQEVLNRVSCCQCVYSADIKVMTHFACADDKENPFTAQQINLFEKHTQNLPFEKSLANSGGIMGWPASHADWVRPGIMLYGVSPFNDSNGISVDLKPVMTLKANIIALRRLKEGDAIGYGASFVCPKDMIVGVVAAGYGDGYPRYIQPGCPVLFRGQQAPILGRVSMDMISVDLTGFDQLKVGEMVTLWGEGLPVETISQWANTSPYELLTGTAITRNSRP